MCTGSKIRGVSLVLRLNADAVDRSKLVYIYN